MDDYISRQAAIDKINERQRKLIYCFGFENDMVKIMNIAKNIITAIPAADAVPVVHGRWIPHREKSREYIGTVLVHVRYDYWLCDTCGYRVENGQPMYNFCPNCGAKMDGERKEETDG